MKKFGFFGVRTQAGVGLGIALVLGGAPDTAKAQSGSQGQESVREIHLNPSHSSDPDPFSEISTIRISARPFSRSAPDSLELNGIHREFVDEIARSSRREQSEDPLSIAGLALKVWDIVQQNRAVLNVETQNVKALPNIAKDRWEVLTGWRPEHGVQYSLELQNFYGITVVKLKYDVSLIYGGSVRGVGKYIASARVVPRHIDVLWGFNLDVRVRESSVRNLGSEKNPFASIGLDVMLNYGSILKQTVETVSYRLDADGAIRDLTNNRSYFSR